MNPELNIFGPFGTRRKDIQDHFNTMKLEAIVAYDYQIFDDPSEFLQILNEIEQLHDELAQVCFKINQTREKIQNVLIEGNVIEE